MRTLLLVTLLLGTSTLIGVVWGVPDALFNEGGPVNLASGALLLWCARLASQIRRIRHVAPERGLFRPATAIWGLLAVGFAFLAADELFAIHENVDRLIHWMFRIRETGVTDRLDDAIVALYGAAGLVLMFLHRAELLRWRSAFRYVAWAAAFSVVMVVLDALTNRTDVLEQFFAGETAVALQSWISVAEDSLKLYAETCLVFAGQDVLGRAES